MNFFLFDFIYLDEEINIRKLAELKNISSQSKLYTHKGSLLFKLLWLQGQFREERDLSIHSTGSSWVLAGLGDGHFPYNQKPIEPRMGNVTPQNDGRGWRSTRFGMGVSHGITNHPKGHSWKTT